MAGFCSTIDADVGLIQALMGSVDCNVQTMSSAAYAAVSGPDSQVGLILTALLTIYVAVLGLRLLLGFAPLRIGEITVTALKLGVVLALATSWPTYQSLVFDTLFHGPEQLGAGIIAAIQPPDSLLRGNPFDALQVVYDQLQIAATFFARSAGPGVSPLTGGAPFAAFSLNAASNLMLLSTVGVMLAAKIVLALLLALGPVFVALLLFDTTRGVFEGWLRASLAFAFAPLFATLALVVQLVLVEPHLIALARMIAATGQQDFNAATAVFLLSLIGAAVSAAGLVAAGVIAFGFKLPARAAAAPESVSRAGAGEGAAAAAVAQPPRAAAVAAAAMAMERRDLRVTETPSARRRDGVSASPLESRRPPGPAGRRAQPRRAASSARRDQ